MLKGFKAERRLLQEVPLPIEVAPKKDDKQGIDFYMHGESKTPIAIQLTMYPDFAEDVRKSARAALRKGVPLVYIKLGRFSSIKRAAKLLLQYKDLKENEAALIVEHRGRLLHKRLHLMELAYADITPDEYKA